MFTITISSPFLHYFTSRMNRPIYSYWKVWKLLYLISIKLPLWRATWHISLSLARDRILKIPPWQSHMSPFTSRVTTSLVYHFPLFQFTHIIIFDWFIFPSNQQSHKMFTIEPESNTIHQGLTFDFFLLPPCWMDTNSPLSSDQSPTSSGRSL